MAYELVRRNNAANRCGGRSLGTEGSIVWLEAIELTLFTITVALQALNIQS